MLSEKAEAMICQTIQGSIMNIVVKLNVSYGFFIPCFLIILIFGKLL